MCVCVYVCIYIYIYLYLYLYLSLSLSRRSPTCKILDDRLLRGFRDGHGLTPLRVGEVRGLSGKEAQKSEPRHKSWNGKTNSKSQAQVFARLKNCPQHKNNHSETHQEP